MANVTVSTNPSTTNNTLTVNFTTDVSNITNVQLTKDGSNYISATSFTNTSASFNVASWNNGTYNNCHLKVIYTEASSGGSTGGDSGGSTPATYRITRNLTNCSSSNLANTITQGSAYTSTITANDGYNIGDLTVTMGGVDITSSVVSDNTSLSSDFTITYDLSNCSSSNKATSISSGEIYDTTISPKI